MKLVDVASVHHEDGLLYLANVDGGLKALNEPAALVWDELITSTAQALTTHIAELVGVTPAVLAPQIEALLDDLAAAGFVSVS